MTGVRILDLASQVIERLCLGKNRVAYRLGGKAAFRGFLNKENIIQTQNETLNDRSRKYEG